METRWLLCVLLLCFPCGAFQQTFTYVPSADGQITATNPLRGFVAYTWQYKTAPSYFPHSMENFVLPLNQAMYDWNVFNWTTLESYLTPVAARGHHAIFRFYLDFPGTTLKPTDAIPEFLVNGLKFNHYTQPAVGLAPDFFNETLIAACVQFIHALGAQYDGDPRIAVIEDGLLGHWGEWHMAPNVTLFPGSSIQNQILTAFRDSFNYTQIVTRYPNVLGTYLPSQLPFGYIDQSFAQDTLPASGLGYSCFSAGLQSTNATEIWKTQIIGGEVRPEFWPCIFAENVTAACAEVTTLIPQDWNTCATTVHTSWLWDTYAFFPPGYNGTDKSRALAGALLLGYRYTVTSIQVLQQPIDATHTSVQVAVTIQNLGIAPFYYPLYVSVAVEYTLHNTSLPPIHTTATGTQQMSGHLPGILNTYFVDIPNELSGTSNPNPSNVAAIGGQLLLTSSILLPSQIIRFDVAEDSQSGAVNGTITIPAVTLQSSSSAETLHSVTISLSAWWFAFIQ